MTNTGASLQKAHLADCLAEVELRRRDVQPERHVLWQRRSCQPCDPQLPLAARTGGGRGTLQRSGKQLAGSPVITVPTITLEGDANGAPHPEPGAYRAKFSGKYAHRTISGGVGHNLPQEAPQAFAQATVDVDGY
jgi:pimeloyl-ACP methyl ester carboxylesterase